MAVIDRLCGVQAPSHQRRLRDGSAQPGSRTELREKPHSPLTFTLNLLFERLLWAEAHDRFVPLAGTAGKNADFRGHRLLQTESGHSPKTPKSHEHMESCHLIWPKADRRCVGIPVDRDRSFRFVCGHQKLETSRLGVKIISFHWRSALQRYAKTPIMRS